MRVAACIAVALLGVCTSRVAAQATPSGGRTRVEGVAAVVGSGERVLSVLRSDVTLRARLLLAGRASRLPVGPLPPALLSTTLETLIGEALIAREADRLRAGEPSDEDVDAERQALVAAAGGEARLSALLTRLGVEDEELTAIAVRRAYVQSFLRVNLEGSTVVSDVQVQRVYESGEHPFGERPLEAIREVLRRWIASESLQRDVARWVQVLRSRTPVRIVAEWGSEGRDRAAQ
ncbi:MAG: hypothetical protein AB8I08_32905 [Sandaracinaceae bacterium]